MISHRIAANAVPLTERRDLAAWQRLKRQPAIGLTAFYKKKFLMHDWLGQEKSRHCKEENEK